MNYSNRTKVLRGIDIQLQWNCLNEASLEKRPAVASNRRKLMLLQDNARHVAKAVKETLMQLEWEVLPHPAYSPDLAPSDYYLFRSMQRLGGYTFQKLRGCNRKRIDEWIASKDSNRSIVAESTY